MRFKLDADYCLEGSLQKKRQKRNCKAHPHNGVLTVQNRFVRKKHECPALGLWHRVLQKLEKEEPINS